MRFLSLMFILVLSAAPALSQPRQEAFVAWINNFGARAAAQGVRTDVMRTAFRGVRYNTDVIAKDRNQAEFKMTLKSYLNLVASDTRVANGRKAARNQRRALARLERQYGVPAHVVAAVWGMESNYGNNRGDIPTIEALATLAFDGRRGRFFEKQLVAALKILQAGDVPASRMVGSWAGAMGHTQFIPTSFLAYAVDGTGDGRRDVWADSPVDALASTAAYLSSHGWQKGQPWGFEVALPRGLTVGTGRKSPDAWAALGVRDMSGRPVPNYSDAKIIQPQGSDGPAFMVFKNFDVIRRYNNSILYAVGVGHLSDRINGGGPLQTKW